MAMSVTLAAGMKVKNAAGETVEFTGGTVTMKQLVSKFEFIDGLTWEDGVPVSAADLELSKKIACDPESGATYLHLLRQDCQHRVLRCLATPRPGSPAFRIRYTSSPTSGAPSTSPYPAHQVISDGRKLADVPAKNG